MSDIIPTWTDEEHQRELDLVRKDSSERCALLCEAVAERRESMARELRTEGSFITREYWPFGKIITVVRPAFERTAQGQEAVAMSLRTLAMACRAGWDPRSLKRDKLCYPSDDPTETPYCRVCYHGPCLCEPQT